MKLTLRPLIVGLLIGIASAAIYKRAQAGGDHYFPPVSDAQVKAECGSCHLAFPPSMLPAASWQRMMGELDRHFGDDASVEPALAAKIKAYLVANAGDAGGRAYGRKLLRGVNPGDAPQRITELPKWVREHREVPARDWRDPKVRSKANCTACHADAEIGYFED